MKIDEVTLLAYVDQQLPDAQRAEVAIALTHNSDLRATAAALQASRLPYPTAYTAQALPIMSAELAERLHLLNTGAGTQGNASTTATAIAAGNSNPQVTQHSSRRAALSFGIGLAASFAFGWLARPLLAPTPTTLPLPAAAALPPTPSLHLQSSQASQLGTNWVEAVANYQAMYTRATVDQQPQSAAAAHTVLAEFSRVATPVRVPNLNADGLQFKRVQRLTFGSTPLLQIAYLPKTGKPAALCVLGQSVGVGTSQAAKSIDLKIEQLHGLNMVTWADGALRYAFATDMPTAQALALGKRIAAGEVAGMFNVA